jgi:hypothetical protein
MVCPFWFAGRVVSPTYRDFVPDARLRPFSMPGPEPGRHADGWYGARHIEIFLVHVKVIVGYSKE